MTPATFMDTFTLVRNSLEKQDTRFCEAFPTEKRVAIAFRISHQRCSMKKGLKSATLFKKRLWHRCFPVNFAKFPRTPFLQNTSERMLLCFMAFSVWEFLSQRFKTIAVGKSTLPSIEFYQISRTSSETAKAIATFKETTNCKTPFTTTKVLLLLLPFQIVHCNYFFFK